MFDNEGANFEENSSKYLIASGFFRSVIVRKLLLQRCQVGKCLQNSSQTQHAIKSQINCWFIPTNGSKRISVEDL